MKCENFGCVYARKQGCAIGSQCVGLNEIAPACPHYIIPCDFANCEHCVRAFGKSEMCKLEKEGD